MSCESSKDDPTNESKVSVDIANASWKIGGEVVKPTMAIKRKIKLLLAETKGEPKGGKKWVNRMCDYCGEKGHSEDWCHYNLNRLKLFFGHSVTYLAIDQSFSRLPSKNLPRLRGKIN